MTVLDTPQKLLHALGLAVDDLVRTVDHHDPRDGKLNTQPEFISALHQLSTLRALISKEETRHE